MINVTYYYSACAGIWTKDVRVLSDPWFTDGILDGSWYHYPKTENPLEIIGPYDYIYVSHVHEDHYDPRFLKKYIAKYPHTKIIIPEATNNFLARKMKFHGIPHTITSELRVGDTQMKLFPNESNPYDIDSAFALKTGESSVVNMNDNAFNELQLHAIKDFCQGNPQIALLPYTGAGPYPQNYITDKALLIQRANEKKKAFFDRYLKMRNYLNPKKVIPFAGTYILGGRFSYLNPYRGVADATEVRTIDPNAVILEDGGKSVINTETLIPTSERLNPYPQKDMDAYLETIKNNPMIYDVYFKDLDVSEVPFQRLLRFAYQHAISRITYKEDSYFCVKLLNDEWFACNCNTTKSESFITKDVSRLSPRSEVVLDPKYLFGLITGVFHWNNAQSGSHLRITRTPDVYVEEIENFLYFLHV
jgi:UDP-MurNAc hydroxylase